MLRSARNSCQPWRLWQQRGQMKPPLPTVSKYGAHCHWLWTRHHSNCTDKSAEAWQSAEWGKESHTVNHQGHAHWDHEVHARHPTNANQSMLQCHRKSPQPWSCERHKRMQTGMEQVLGGSSKGFSSAKIPAGRAQANQGVVKVPKLIPASLWDTLARKFGKALPRMSRKETRARDLAFY